jgi:tetratricopeptide (TPR) repeat protein
VGVAEYEKLISENNSNNMAYLAYANTLYYNNSFKKALEVTELGILNCERKVYLTNLKAKCQWAIGQKNEAIELLKELISTKPDVSTVHDLTDYYIELKDTRSALNLLHKSYFTYHNNENILYKFAKTSYDIGQKEVCVLLYKELLALKPDNSDYWCLLGNAYLDLQLFNHALNAYEKAAELSNHKEDWIYGNIGNLYNNKNLYTKAEENLKKSLVLNEKSEYSLNRLSQVYTSQQEDNKKLTEILATAKKKISLDVIE